MTFRDIENFRLVDGEKLDNLPLDVQSELDNKVDKIVGKGLSTEDYTTAEKNKLAIAEITTNKGIANGYAGLDGTGKVPASQLPSYVDDVLEFADFASFPNPGETGKLYVALDTNLVYRWTGSTYAEVVGSIGVWRGEYDNGTSYILDDRVGYLGSSYICTSPTTGNLPTNVSFWDLLAAKGDQGDKGDTGDTGAQGDQGIPGNDGIMQSVVGGTNITVDSSDPANPIVNSTGGDMLKSVYDTAGVNEQLVGETATQTIANKTLTNAIGSFVRSGNGVAVNIQQSGSGTSLNIDNSGSGNFIVVDTNKMVLDNAGNLSATNLSGTNTGDQTDMSGISDTKANFNAACSDGDFLYVGDVTGGGESTQSTVTAGEDVTAGDAITYYDGLEITVDTGSQIIGFGNIGRDGNTFTPSTSFDITKITIPIKKFSGSTWGDITLEIKATSAGLPTGSALASKTITAITNTDYEEKDFILSSPLSVSSGTMYSFELIASGCDDQNGYAMQRTSSSVYAGGTWIYSNDSGSSYTLFATADIDFKLYGTPAYIKADASDGNRINFVGFASETVTSGNPLLLDTAGVNANQSGLTVGSEYYLSNTPGAISTTPGTNSVKVGKAISSSELEIFTGGEAPGGGFTSSARAYLGTTQTGVVSGTYTKVTLDTESYDIDGEFDPTTNNRFTATNAGRYSVSGGLRLGIAVTGEIDIAIYVNGSIHTEFPAITNGENRTVNITDILNLSASDYVELYCRHYLGSDNTILTSALYTYMSIAQIQ